VPARFGHVTIDTTDLPRAVAFWSAVFGGEAKTTPDGAFAIVAARGAPDLMLQRVDAIAGGKNPVHLDLLTADLDAEVARLVELGASEVARQTGFGTRWATLTDTDGHLFDVVEQRLE
jgi:predicted enzyme related to lactoylglutathione lyase